MLAKKEGTSFLKSLPKQSKLDEMYAVCSEERLKLTLTN